MLIQHILQNHAVGADSLETGTKRVSSVLIVDTLTMLTVMQDSILQSVRA